MASLQWKNDVAYLCHHYRGKVKWIRLGRISKTNANRILQRYEADLAYDRVGQEVPESTISFQEVADEYIANAQKAEDTLRGERYRLKIIKGIMGTVPIAKVDRAIVTNYKERRAHLNSTSMNKDLRAIKLVLKYAFEKGYISTEKHKEIKPPAEAKVPPNHFPAELLPKIFAAMDEYTRIRFQVLYYLGLRPAELYRIELDHIDLKNAILLIPKTKGGLQQQYRAVPIPKNLLSLFSRLKTFHLFATSGKERKTKVIWDKRRPEQKYLFCHPDGRPIETKNGLRKGLKNALKKTGIKHRITPYTFRHQFATTILRKTKDLRGVQELLGHRNLTTTQKYTHVLLDHLRKTIEAAK